MMDEGIFESWNNMSVNVNVFICASKRLFLLTGMWALFEWLPKDICLSVSVALNEIIINTHCIIGAILWAGVCKLCGTNSEPLAKELWMNRIWSLSKK